MHFRNEMAQHRFGHLEVRDHAVFHRTHRHDVRRGPAQHSFRVVTHRQHLVRAGLHRHDRWLAQDDALVLDVHKRVRRAKIDPDVAR